MIKAGQCPRCIHGNLQIEWEDGWREHCLQCGYYLYIPHNDVRIPRDIKVRKACEVGLGFRSNSSLEAPWPRFSRRITGMQHRSILDSRI